MAMAFSAVSPVPMTSAKRCLISSRCGAAATDGPTSSSSSLLSRCTDIHGWRVLRGEGGGANHACSEAMHVRSDGARRGGPRDSEFSP